MSLLPFVEKSTPTLKGCSGRIFVTTGQSLQCPITVDLESVRVEILVNGVSTSTATTDTIVLRVLTADPLDVKYVAYAIILNR